MENPSTFVEATKRMQHPDAHFYIEWGRETLGFSLLLNQSANLGVKTERDSELRKLFRNFRFRRALSQAIDREGIAMAITSGQDFVTYKGARSTKFNSYIPTDYGTSKRPPMIDG